MFVFVFVCVVCVWMLVLVGRMPRDFHSHGKMKCANENVHEKYKHSKRAEASKDEAKKKSRTLNVAHENGF